MSFVLDTNTVIDFFKGRERVVERLLATPRAEVAAPAVVLHELETAVAKSLTPEPRRRLVSDFFSAVTVLPFSARGPYRGRCPRAARDAGDAHRSLRHPHCRDSPGR